VNYAQIILNLLDNAFEEEPNEVIVLELKKLVNSAYLSVKDQGRGFPQMVMDKIGEPCITTKSHGTGLGLYVSQLFVESLGGDFKIYNNEPKGAIVQLSWPIRSGEKV